MATVQPQTTQLEFYQAMADFKTMFPLMDDDVIEAVLRCNEGAVDATIDQLLAMSTDNENEKMRLEMEVRDRTGGGDTSSTVRQLPQSVPPDVTLGTSGKPRWDPSALSLLIRPLPPDFLRLHDTAQTESELEDERIATLLQNEEFMAELRWNKDFISTLDWERESTESGGAAGGGLNSNADEAAFRERLRTMGKMSKRKFAQLARVFTKKRTKNRPQQQLLTASNDDDSD